MSSISLRSPCKTHHHFDTGNPTGERHTRMAMWLTVVMMAAEITGGWWLGSMALLADGWHMGSHALALGLAAFAYAYARSHGQDPRFAFGTWKVEVLAGYTSALLLLGIAAAMLVESALRVVHPVAIHYREAIALAVLGLVVNLVCARLLHGSSGHAHAHTHGHVHDAELDHGHTHAHAHAPSSDHGHHDLNLRSAYVHVLMDAATSVLAIVALAAGWWWGAAWLDPVMGLAGSVLVASWAVGLLRQSGRVLLDAHMTDPVVQEIREAAAALPAPASLADLHVWRVGKGRYAAVISVRAPDPASASLLRQALAVHEELVHISVEWLPPSESSTPRP